MIMMRRIGGGGEKEDEERGHARIWGKVVPRAPDLIQGCRKDARKCEIITGRGKHYII